MFFQIRWERRPLPIYGHQGRLWLESESYLIQTETAFLGLAQKESQKRPPNHPPLLAHPISNIWKKSGRALLNRYAFCIHSNQLDIGVRQKQEWSDTLGIATIISLTEAIAVGKMGSLQGSLIPRTLFTGNPQGT